MLFFVSVRPCHLFFYKLLGFVVFGFCLNFCILGERANLPRSGIVRSPSIVALFAPSDAKRPARVARWLVYLSISSRKEGGRPLSLCLSRSPASAATLL